MSFSSLISANRVLSKVLDFQAKTQVYFSLEIDANSQSCFGSNKFAFESTKRAPLSLYYHFATTNIYRESPLIMCHFHWRLNTLGKSKHSTILRDCNFRSQCP